jgi:quinol monooxygenase YgiN
MSTPLPAKPAVPEEDLFRNADNPDEIVIFFEWDKIEKARKFAQSEDLKKAMERAGVIDKPDIYFLEEIEPVFV